MISSKYSAYNKLKIYSKRPIEKAGEVNPGF